MIDESMDASRSERLLDPSENAQLYILFHLGGEAAKHALLPNDVIKGSR
jgi:hypothetical protein